MKKLWRPSVQDEVENELAFHIEMTTRELTEQGMSPDKARAEAERRFGAASVDAECRRYANERDRNARRAELLDELRQDVAFAGRQLRRSPAFAAIAVITLALGIGATAAIFSALDAVVLRPMPFDHPERIVMVQPSLSGRATSPSAAEYVALRGVSQFERIAGIQRAGISLAAGDVTEIFLGGRVTTDYFAVFGVSPALGRAFTAQETDAGARVVVLSHRLWTTHFAADRNILGRVLTVDGLPYAVVGVMPASFDYMRQTEELWVPLVLPPDAATKYSERYFQSYARLRLGVTQETARAAAAAVERRVAEQAPERSTPLRDFDVVLTRFDQSIVGDYRSLLLVLLGAVGFVLLIACTNVANLLLARGNARARELAIRAALGAGRGRLTRQLLTETLVLAVAGAVLGLGVAFALLEGILLVSPGDVPRLEQATIDWRVLAFTLGVGVVSSVICGLVPAIRAAGRRVQTTLREGGRGTSGARDPLGAVLVAAEVALAITLLVGSALLVRTAWLTQRVNPGFDPHGVMTAQLLLPAARYPDGAAIVRAYETLRDETSRLPGVKAAALASVVPFTGSQMNGSVQPEGTKPEESNARGDVRLVSPGYFALLGIPFIAGRDVSRDDRASTRLVVVINQALAKELWPALDPRAAIGKRITALQFQRGVPHYMEIVGVVRDIRDASLTQSGSAQFYVPVAQAPEPMWQLIQGSLNLVARASNASTPVDALTKPMQKAIAAFDPSLPVAGMSSLDSNLEGSIRTAIMNTLLLSILSAIALVLAMVGIYGVVSYFVSQRTHEIGVRMALGATPALIWAFVVRRGLAPIVAGLVAGIALSFATTSFLREQLYGVGPHDPATLAAVALTLIAVALLAIYVPARRAMRVPAMVALSSG